MNIKEINNRLKPIMLNICGNRFDDTKCIWDMKLSDEKCIDLMCILDDEFNTNFIDMDLNTFKAMGYYSIIVYINHNS